jgi:hypothetical protein
MILCAFLYATGTQIIFMEALYQAKEALVKRIKKFTEIGDKDCQKKIA